MAVPGVGTASDVPKDLAWLLWRHGYAAIPAARRAGTDPDGFVTRLLGRHAYVARGEAGAGLFHDHSLVARGRAVPVVVGGVLLGRSAPDGPAEDRRRLLVAGLLDADAVRELDGRVARDLGQAASFWTISRRVVLFEELVHTFGSAALGWAGAADTAEDKALRSRDLALMVDGSGGAQGAVLAARRARRRSLRWARTLVREARSSARTPAAGSPLEVLALGPGAELTDAQAGCELVDVLRPVVAAAWPAAFAAVALHEHPEWRDRILHDGTACAAFAGEVRRLYPFVPALMGRLRRDAHLGGRNLARGARVVLDVPGTHRDPASWDHPDTFDPTRFLDGSAERLLVPVDGSEQDALTSSLLATTLRCLAGLDYRLVSEPAFDVTRIPSLPDRAVEITDVRRRDG